MDGFRLMAEGGLIREGLPALGVAIIAVYFLMSSLRKKMKRNAQRPQRETPFRDPPKPDENSRTTLDRQQRLQSDLEALMLELEQLSRTISAQIDTRFAKLEASIRDADRRIAVLNRLSGQGGEPASTGGSTTGSDRTTSNNGAIEVIYELADTGLGPVDIARKLGKTPGEVELILNLRRQHQHLTPPPNGRES